MAILGIGSVAAQLIVFLVVSVLLVIASRTIFDRFLTRTPAESQLTFGVEAMLGQIGTVVESSQGAMNQSAVKVSGTDCALIEGKHRLQRARLSPSNQNSIYALRAVHRFSEEQKRYNHGADSTVGHRLSCVYVAAKTLPCRASGVGHAD
jgi:membrane protein implicated in regulation of membrane protease activity